MLLDSSYAVNTSQLSLLVPALTYSSAKPRDTAFAIRGLGSSVVDGNLFNKDNMQNLTIQAGNSGLILGSPSDPRDIGATLRARQ